MPLLPNDKRPRKTAQRHRDDQDMVADLAGRGAAKVDFSVQDPPAVEGEVLPKRELKTGYGFGGSTPHLNRSAIGPSMRLKPWREALDRAIAQSDGKKLRAMAEALIKQALKGDVSALKEIGDRLDGKAVQQVEAKVEASITITVADTKL